MAKLGVVSAVLSLWLCCGLCLRNCPRDKLTLLVSLSCNDPSTAVGSYRSTAADGGLSCDYFVLAAILLATERLNQRSTILEGVRVDLVELDSRDVVAMVSAVRAGARGQIHGLLGPANPGETHLFIPVITNKLQIPSVTAVVSRENVVDSRLYHRTLPSNTYIVSAMMSLADHFQWHRIGLLISASLEYSELYEMFMMNLSNHLTQLTDGLVDVENIESFTNEAQLDQSINHFVAEGIRIIFAFAEPPDAVKMICKASKAGLTSSGHVWVLPAYTDPDWWRKLQSLSNCTEDELQTALETTLFVAAVKYPPFIKEDLTQNPRDFLQDLLNKTQSTFSITDPSTLYPLLTHSHATSAYDSVWTMAKAWDIVLTETDCKTNSANLTERLEEALGKISDLEFQNLWGREGCSINTSHTDSQKFYGSVLITQFQGGRLCPVALSLPHSQPSRESIVLLRETDSHPCSTVTQVGWWIKNFTCPSATNCTFNFQWRGDSGPPSTPFSLTDSQISTPALCIVIILVVVMVALSISLTIYNIRHRDNKFVKATSPRLSVGITAALVLVLPNAFIQGLVFSASAFNITGTAAHCLCWFDLWLPAIGITLLYSTLLAKNYRIYRIFYNKKLKVRQDDKLTDGVLLLISFLLLLPIMIISVVTISTMNPTIAESIIPLDKSSASLHYIRVSYCKDPHIGILSSITGYINLLLLAVVILAILTMRVKNRFGMDGKATAAITVCVIAGGLTVLTTIEVVNLKENPTGFTIYFYSYASFILIVGLVILGSLYLPLYYNVYKDHRRSSLESANDAEMAAESVRVEHYKEVLSEASNLKRQLNEIELRLQKFRTETKHIPTIN